MRSYVEAAPLPPDPRQPIRSQDSGDRARRKPIRALGFWLAMIVAREEDNLHWRWITECFPQIALHDILGREIDLLKELRRD